jgi:hypothetical protein
MNVKITHPVPGRPDLRVGHVYDLTPKEAKPIIENDWGFQAALDVPSRVAKPKQEKSDDGKNKTTGH